MKLRSGISKKNSKESNKKKRIIMNISLPSVSELGHA